VAKGVLMGSGEGKGFDSWENFDSTKRWMNKLQARRKGALSTRRVFVYYLTRFCQFAKKNPDQLITERKQHLKVDDEFIRRRHEETVESFAKELREGKASPNTISTAIAAVRSFYKSNYMPLVEVDVPTGFALRQLSVPSKEQLKALCETDRVEHQPWLKAWILAQSESGLGNVDLLKLELRSKWCHSAQYGYLGEQLRNQVTPIHIHVIREKTFSSGVGWFDTFLGERSIEALKDYVDFRQPRLFNKSSRTIQLEVRKAGEEASISTKDTPLVPYSFRKYFITRLKLAGVNNDVVEYMAGHSLGKVRAAYFIPSVMELRNLYSKYYSTLDIYHYTEG